MRARRISFVTNAPLTERPEGLFSPHSAVRRQIILPGRALENAGADVHVISLPDWPREQVAPILERSDRIVFGAMRSEQDEVAYRNALRACGSQRRLIFFVDGEYAARPDGFYNEVSPLSHAWLVMSQASQERLSAGRSWPVHVYPEPAESARGAPRVPRRGLRHRAALWIARRHRVGLDPWRVKLLWFGEAVDAHAVLEAIPELHAFASTTPLALECLTEAGSALEAHATRTATAASPFRVTVGQRLPETVGAALQDCDAVLLPKGDTFIDALYAGRFAIARPHPVHGPLREFGWVGGSVTEGIRWFLSHPQDAFRRLAAGHDYVSAHHSMAAVARFWISVLESPAEQHPGDLVERGRRAYANRNLEQAEQCLARALEANSAMPEVRQLLGNVFQDQGKLDSAISCYRRAIRLDADLAGAHNDLGTAYVSKGWHREAVECYLRAVSLDPDNHVAHANLAQTLLKLGRRRDALRHVRAALRLRLGYWMRRTL